jgi:hypothetical protein
MGFPEPVSGLIIRYSYLWRAEQLSGLEEGRKDRPCAIILVTSDADGKELVTVLPITHSPPSDPQDAAELPQETKIRLGLDSDRSWVVLTEANRFAWPGPDLRFPAGEDAASVAYGLVSRRFFRELRDRFVAMLRSSRVRVVERDD